MQPSDALFLVAGGGIGLLWHRYRGVRAELADLRRTVHSRFAESEEHVGELDRACRTDALTGLANQRHLDEELPRLLAYADARMSSVAAIAIDLHGLGDHADVHGQLAADRLLKELSGAWLGVLRDDDQLYRLGDSSFLALLPGCSQVNAERVATRLAIASGGCPCSTSAVSWDGDEDADALVGRTFAAVHRTRARIF